jgi:hypothetical protein
MSILDTIADGLARDALAREEELNDLTVIDRIAKHIGTASPTVEEAFKTAIRMRRAELRAQRLMASLREKETPAPGNLPARRDVGSLEP